MSNGISWEGRLGSTYHGRYWLCSTIDGWFAVYIANAPHEPVLLAYGATADDAYEACVKDDKARTGPLTWFEGPWGMTLAGDGDFFGDRTTYDIFGPAGKDPTKEPSRTNPAGYHLWVWSGPAEAGGGLMGADLREMKRAKWLNFREQLADPQKTAEAIDATGIYGR